MSALRHAASLCACSLAVCAAFGWDGPTLTVDEKAPTVVRTWPQVKASIAESIAKTGEGYFCYSRHYNDIGPIDTSGTLTAEELKTQFAMACVLASPITVRGPAPAAVKAWLGNSMLMNVNNDKVGRQGHVVAERDGVLVVKKYLWGMNDANAAVAFYNPTDAARSVSVSARELEFAGEIKWKDRFDAARSGSFEGTISVDVPPHGALLYHMSGQPVMRERYGVECATWMPGRQALVWDCVFVPKTGFYRLEIVSEKGVSLVVNGLSSGDVGGRFSAVVQLDAPENKVIVFGDGIDGVKALRVLPDNPPARRVACLAPRGTELFRCQVHRGGGRDTRPDNALETFLWCWGHGVAPEADARLTKDGVAIAMHDGTLKRVGRGISEELASTSVTNLNWAEIRDVDTGSYLGPEYSSTRIATIDSIFAAMSGRPDRFLYLDEKGAPPELVAKLARKYGVEKQIYYTSPRFKLMSRWQKVVPGGLGMVWLGTWPKDNSPEAVARANQFLEDSLDRMEATGWNGISQIQIHIRTDLSLEDPFCPSSDCIRRAIRRLHDRGITVQSFTWTEGANKDVLRKIWNLGFDNMATDDPIAMFELLPEFVQGQANHL